MEFRVAYLQAMRERDPKGFNQLVRSGQMEAFLQAKTTEAYAMLEQLLAGQPRDPNGAVLDLVAQRQAERTVIETLIEEPLPTPETTA